MQTTPPVNEIIACLNWGHSLFTSRGISHPRFTIEVLLGHLLKKGRADLYLSAGYHLTNDELAVLTGYIAERVKGRPLWQLIGQVEFFGLSFYVTGDVLIPRPETEILVETANLFLLKSSLGAGKKIADIGAGCGAIAIALAKSHPSFSIHATDISGKALLVAKKNISLHGVQKQITLFRGNLYDALPSGFPSTYDMIVSNPPYISDGEWHELPREVRKYEPPEALRGGADGLCIVRELVNEAPHYLTPGGRLLMEIGRGREEAVTVLLNHTGAFEDITAHPDLNGIPRVISACRKND